MIGAKLGACIGGVFGGPVGALIGAPIGAAVGGFVGGTSGGLLGSYLAGNFAENSSTGLEAGDWLDAFLPIACTLTNPGAAVAQVFTNHITMSRVLHFLYLLFKIAKDLQSDDRREVARGATGLGAAGVGAMIGTTILPGVGTAVGGLLGAAVGWTTGWLLY